jgi:surface protein
MNYMFYGCQNLTTLDLSSFNTSNVTSYSSMLSSVSAACTIYINPNTFIKKSTGQTFTPADLGWSGTEFTPKYN